VTDLDYMSFAKSEVASCCQTQQTGKDQSTNQLPGTSRDTVATFDGGTKRGGRKPAYHLVPIELMEAVARTREEGDRKYAPGNWMKGSKEFFVDCLGHAIEHLVLCVWDEEESLWTHLGHAATNIGFILWALARGKVSRRDFQRAAVVAQDEKREAMIRSQMQQQQELLKAQMAAQLQSMPLMKSSSEPSPTTIGGCCGSSVSR
jgi:hypothetical protein